ncbi:restriction endonuclease subunit S [Acinetobacter ursingii]|uniref:restriction endonuclease subunit S n=1 Tax=Acinetobacter ursingii TaxID=108980 RepID=UPI00195B6CED|nr:restriction endonuclease subunit S [Acinetobacter ursingii]VTX77889.1 Type-1 restriction enzyme EcoKI specificity protein [Acinetobacter ursingii]
MSDWVTAKLKEVAKVVTGKTPQTSNSEYYGGDIPFVSPADLNEGILRETKTYLTSSGADQVYRVPKNTVLISCIGNLGKLAITSKEVCFNQQINGLIFDEQKIFPKYGFYFAQTLKPQLEKASSSTTLPIVNKSKFSDLEIKYPPLAQQRRIAAILDQADELRQKRQQAIEKLDQLLQATFIDMFGDPVSNPKGWEVGSLNNYGSYKNGLNFGKGESGNQVLYIGVGDFKQLSKIDDVSKLSTIDLDELPSADYFIKNGDLLFVRSNGNKELVGRCIAVYPDEKLVTYSGFCIRYRIERSELTSAYLVHLFRAKSFKQTIFDGGQGANIQNINQQLLSRLQIPIPPKDLQEKWSKIALSIEDQKQNHYKQLDMQNQLFSSLQNQAFSRTL